MPELDTEKPKPKKTNAVVLEDFLGSDRFLDHLKQILPEHLDSDRFATIAMRQIRNIPELGKCSMQSIAASVMEAGTLGLEIGTQGECWLIPRETSRKDSHGEWSKEWEASLQIGYLGHLALAWRSTQISAIQVDVVCTGDKFDFQRGTQGYLHHKPAKGREIVSGNIEWAYAIVQTIYGGEVWMVIDHAEIERLRNSGPSGNSPAWRDWYDGMAMGKVLKRTLKFCPKSSELAQAITIDDRADANLAPNFAAPLPTNLLPEQTGDAATNALNRQMAGAQSGGGGAPGSPPSSGGTTREPEPVPAQRGGQAHEEPAHMSDEPPPPDGPPAGGNPGLGF